ncbi:Yip1 family protein [Celerinatantimonas yamalensis]|uniref:Yip1 family protein n=1 Tax=Celerinatantimonas yamalensis TaxID=559956 RepID=A0ABW9GCN3_9GAMM
MIQHVWGLLHNPDHEWQQISQEHESVGHLYMHHVLWLAAIPVISSLIGTTRFGWSFSAGHGYHVSLVNGVALAIAFYALILLAVTLVGSVLYWKAQKFEQRSSQRECIVFAGYTATPLFLSGIVAVYPIFWLCLLAMTLGIIYSGYLLYRGIPSFLGISHRHGFILSTTTLGFGVLILELLLVIVVLLWSMGSESSVVWQFF